MKYLVMECTLGYAVVLDSNGRFLRVPNLGYEVGQQLEYVEVFSVIDELPYDKSQASESVPTESNNKKKIVLSMKKWVAVAACFCILVLGGTIWSMPAGTVRIKINPDVRMTVNRFDRVVKIEGLNEDGKKLISDYNPYGKDTKTVSDYLADKAFEMGYLKKGGHIAVAADSKRAGWKKSMEDKILIELETHMNKGDEFDDDSKYEDSPSFVIDTEILDDDELDEYFDKYEDDDDENDNDDYDEDNDDEHDGDDDEDEKDMTRKKRKGSNGEKDGDREKKSDEEDYDEDDD